MKICNTDDQRMAVYYLSVSLTLQYMNVDKGKSACLFVPSLSMEHGAQH